MDYWQKVQLINRKQYLTIKICQGIAPIACKQAHGVVRNQGCSQVYNFLMLNQIWPVNKNYEKFQKKWLKPL